MASWYGTLALTLFLCLACGKSEEEANLQSGGACTANPSQLTLRLGQTQTFQLSAPEAEGKLTFKAKSTRYIGDTTGGRTFNSDTNPIATRVDQKTPGNKSFKIQRAYAIKEGGSNEETRYVQRYPGSLEELVRLSDEDGKTFDCRFTVKLAP